MVDPVEILKEDVQEALDLLIASVKAEWRAQGKVASGRAMRTIEAKTTTTLHSVIGRVLVQDYMAVQDRGVPASRIPFSGRTGRGGRSAFIEGLKKWSRYVRPGLSDRERTSFAFAVATVMKKEGMPTIGSRRYAENGRRLNWSRFAFEAVRTKLDEIMALSQWADTMIENIIADAGN